MQCKFKVYFKVVLKYFFVICTLYFRKMFRYFIFILFISFCFGCSSNASDGEEAGFSKVWSELQVEYDEVSSFFINKEIPFIAILPKSYNDKDSFPVMYLLHNHGNNANVFLDSVPGLVDLVDKLQIVVIFINTAEGWYIDSPRKQNWKYETFITTELFPYIKKNYKINTTKEKTGITGFSMGGYGSIYLAFKHPEMFGYVGSVSGGMNLVEFPNLGNLSEVFGNQSLYLSDWKKHSPYYMLDSIDAKRLNFHFHLICGESDFFLNSNRAFSKKLDSLDVEHTYSEIEGIHKWNFARKMIVGQLKDFARSTN